MRRTPLAGFSPMRLRICAGVHPAAIRSASIAATWRVPVRSIACIHSGRHEPMRAPASSLVAELGACLSWRDRVVASKP